MQLSYTHNKQTNKQKTIKQMLFFTNLVLRVIRAVEGRSPVTHGMGWSHGN